MVLTFLPYPVRVVVVTYDWEDDGEEEANSTLTTSTPKTFLGFVANGVSYVLFGLAVVAFYSFFAPFLGTPILAWYAVVVPPIPAPTESDVIIDVAPLLSGVATALVAIFLR